MKIESGLTEDAILKIIGGRLAQLRLAANLTQGQLAEQAGLGLRTVQRLELGAAATQLSGFIRICRVLGLVERLDALVPEPSASPIALLERQGKRRQRARNKKVAEAAATKWTWGETA